jgi:hypothetical protein
MTQNRTKRAISIIEACADPHLFAPWFRDPATWTGWFTFLRALFALPMTPEQLALYSECTARTEASAGPATEGWLIIGRRGGKSFMMAVVAVFLACFRSYRPFLQPGERATVMVIATDRKQARVITRYVRGLLTGIPMLARMLDRETAESFDLAGHVTIEVAAASYKTTRGYAVAACLADELAFWPTDGSAVPDYEILDAIRPGMATIPGALLLCASSPYARRGALWDAWRKHYGRNGDPALVWKAPTRTMNPTVPQSVIDEAMERDPASACAEFGAEFRSDIAAFISREIVDACIAVGRYELPFMSGTAYVGAVDPSGGSSDSMTLAIACRNEAGRGVLCCLREAKPPFSPEAVVADFARTLKQYRVDRVTGDRWGGEFVREPFRLHGIEYQLADRPKSDFYRDLLPLINSAKIELLDNKRMITQLCGLERRVSRVGKDLVDHGPGGHDDLINSAAAALVLVSGEARALWQREAFGVPVEMPRRPALIFATLVAAKNGCAGICYWARTRVPGGLCLVDIEPEQQLSPQLLHGVAARLLELTTSCTAQDGPMIFCSSELCGTLERLGYHGEALDGVLDDPPALLGVSAAAHIARGEVHIAAEVLRKQNIPFSFLQGSAVMEDGGGPLGVAFAASVALLDENRAAA